MQIDKKCTFVSVCCVTLWSAEVMEYTRRLLWSWRISILDFQFTAELAQPTFFSYDMRSCHLISYLRIQSMMTSSFYSFSLFQTFLPFRSMVQCIFCTFQNVSLIFKAKSKRFLLNYLAVATFFSTLKCTRRDLGHRE